MATFGTILCVVEVPLSKADHLWGSVAHVLPRPCGNVCIACLAGMNRWLESSWMCCGSGLRSGSRRRSRRRISTSSYVAPAATAPVGVHERRGAESPPHGERVGLLTDERGGDEGENRVSDVDVDEREEMQMEGNVSSASSTGMPPCEEQTEALVSTDEAAPTHLAAVAVAFLTLALTAGIGIVCTTYFEQRAELQMFGYAAVDQVLLPFTTLPFVALATRWHGLARFLGEPFPKADSGDALDGFRDTLRRSWQETEFKTLIPFRGATL